MTLRSSHRDRLFKLFGVAVVTSALVACGTPTAHSSSSASHTPTPAASPSAGSAAGQPTATQRIVCSDEAREDLSEALKLSQEPTTRSSYTPPLFTCDYALPMGSMRVSVSQSASPVAAKAYLAGRAAALHATKAVAGLGERAMETSTGIILVTKDSDTLEVDTTKLKTDAEHRADVATEVAVVILGCWVGN